MSDPTTNKALVTEFIDALFTRGELDAVDRYLAPGFVNHLEALIAEGDLVTERFTARGTHRGEVLGVPPTGRRVVLAGINIFRVQGGRLVERWGRTDDLGLLRQLGVVPPMAS